MLSPQLLLKLRFSLHPRLLLDLEHPGLIFARLRVELVAKLLQHIGLVIAVSSFSSAATACASSLSPSSCSI
jgi:hypothetical protein